MRRVGGSRDDGLGEKLLPRPAQPMNSARPTATANYLTGNAETGADGESIEMSDLDGGAMSRRKGRGSPPTDRAAGGKRAGHAPEETFVIHPLELHHTMAGVALQYRCTVDAIMRLNGFRTQQDLHSKVEIKVPAARYGALYADPDSYKSENTADSTHTTAAPRLPTSADMMEGNTMLDGVDEAQEADNATKMDTGEYLAQLDTNMQTAIAAMDDALAQQVVDSSPVATMRQETPVEGLMAFYPKDWRVLFAIVLCVSLATIPLLAIYIIPSLISGIKSPPPHNGPHNGPHHGEMD